MPAAPLLAALLVFAPPSGDGEPGKTPTLTPGEWPMFRGPNGSGIGADPLPADLIREENLVWRVDVPGRGWASPVVADGPSGKTVYVATAEQDGTTQSVLAYDLATGAVRWNRLLFVNDSPDFCHPTNTYASCTPVATAEAVFAHFGKYGTARLDPADGHTVWERRDLRCDHFRGPASSPLLVQGEGVTPRLVVPFDGIDEQYVVALDAATGETLWRYDRPGMDELIPDKRKAYGTPVELPGWASVLTTGARETVALNPAIGEPVARWRHGGMNSGSVPQVPLALPDEGDPGPPDAASILITTGDAPTELVELSTVWPVYEGADPTLADGPFGRSASAVPRRATPLLVGSRADTYPLTRILTVDDGGVAAVRFLMADDGSLRPTARVRLGDEFWSSPVRAADTAFVFGKGGVAASFDLAAEQFAPAAKSTLDDGVWATPALAGGGLVLRTGHTLRFYKPGGTTE